MTTRRSFLAMLLCLPGMGWLKHLMPPEPVTIPYRTLPDMIVKTTPVIIYCLQTSVLDEIKVAQPDSPKDGKQLPMLTDEEIKNLPEKFGIKFNWDTPYETISFKKP